MRARGVGLALPAPVLPVGPVDLDDPDVHVRVGIHAAGDGACLYDGQCHLFSVVEGMARTRWPPDL
jgi:hypothetical protein